MAGTFTHQIFLLTMNIRKILQAEFCLIGNLMNSVTEIYSIDRGLIKLCLADRTINILRKQKKFLKIQILTKYILAVLRFIKVISLESDTIVIKLIQYKNTITNIETIEFIVDILLQSYMQKLVV